MSWRIAFFFMCIAFVVVNCSRNTTDVVESQVRTMKPAEISSFHPQISVTLGWVPYEDRKLVKTGRNQWKVMKKEANARSSKVPVIMVSYPESRDSILLDMNIENELLGKLIKHSAITQETISRPFTEFFERAKCEKCHPADVKVDFGK